MRVLVAVFSKHGSTSEIARTITADLTLLGIDAEEWDTSASPRLDDYDAVVVGSAIYMGNWLADARSFVEDNRELLETMPVWLFSSGPLGTDELKPVDDPKRITDALGLTHVQDHIIFPGRLDKSKLGVGERLITRAVHAPEGDFRDWEAVRVWSREIAAAIREPQTHDG